MHYSTVTSFPTRRLGGGVLFKQDVMRMITNTIAISHRPFNLHPNNTVMQRYTVFPPARLRIPTIIIAATIVITLVVLRHTDIPYFL